MSTIKRGYLTEVELRIVREMVADDRPLPAGLARLLLRDRDEWVDRAMRPKEGQ